MSVVVSKPFASQIGVLMPYLSPYVNVRLGVTFQTSWPYTSYSRVRKSRLAGDPEGKMVPSWLKVNKAEYWDSLPIKAVVAFCTALANPGATWKGPPLTRFEM